MGKIILKEYDFTFAQLQHGGWVESDPYFVSCLSFCQSWLKGQKNFIIHTSGSTGSPQPISINREQMECSAAATKEFFNVPNHAVLFCCLNTESIAGKMMLVRAMEWESNLILVKPEKNPLRESWLPLEMDFAAMVPMQIQACLDDTATALKIKKIKTLVIGGAPIPKSLLDQIHLEKIKAYQTYGMTETVSHIAVADIGKDVMKYRVLPKVKIGTDPDDRLWVESPMSGNQRIQTKDIVYLHDSATFSWLGRSDFIINSGGIKIQPELIEKAISQLIQKYYGNVNFFVGGIIDPILGEKAILLLEKKELGDNEAAFLLKHCRKILPKFHAPKEVMGLEKFVYTASGKINRHATLASL